MEPILWEDCMDSSQLIHFEQPLTERMRTVLRLEALFEQADFGLGGDTAWHSKTAIASLADILVILSRGDVRSEVIKEIERIQQALAAHQQHPNVDGAMLGAILEECEHLIGELKTNHSVMGTKLKEDELLNNVIQRSGIPGGTCSFDLPAFHYWLQQSPEHRRVALDKWFKQFDTLKETTRLILRVTRGSADPVTITAEGGVLQRNLEKGSRCHLVRVGLPADSPCFVEISGSKLFFTVRFMQQITTAERPEPVREDVRFQLSCCGL